MLFLQHWSLSGFPQLLDFGKAFFVGQIVRDCERKGIVYPSTEDAAQ